MKHGSVKSLHAILIMCVLFADSTPAAHSAYKPALINIDLHPRWDSTTPLPNPHKSWYHHYIDNGLRKYLIEDDSEFLNFPGMDHIYLRLAWSYLEPEEGEFDWLVIDPLIEKWTARGLGVSFRISCKETGTSPVQQQYATPKWLADADAKGGFCKGR